MREHTCAICGKHSLYISNALGVCLDCIRAKPEALAHTARAHERARAQFDLPLKPPRSAGGIRCDQCANRCRMGDGEWGYCGLRMNVEGQLRSLVSTDSALAHVYTDPLPTNCCAAWFCPGCTGYDQSTYRSVPEHHNLAVFFYGCNFDCLYCQNWSHKEIGAAPRIKKEDLVGLALNPSVSCVCFFGGSPEPQLPFAIGAAESMLKEKSTYICWEWNGCGNPKLVKRAADLSAKSGGVVKFDLKAADPSLSMALSGVSNEMAFQNFAMLGECKETLTATTLLVPGYVDAQEVEGIARFIGEIDPQIPYSLLVFHPDFYMADLPITPPSWVRECYRAAKRHLKRVNVGNKHLLTS